MYYKKEQDIETLYYLLMKFNNLFIIRTKKYLVNSDFLQGLILEVKCLRYDILIIQTS
jgi:hypothetical protein